MNRSVWTVAFAAALALTTTAWGQSGLAPLAGEDVGVETLASLAQLAEGGGSVNELVRAELADFIVGAIRDYFSDIRATWGLTLMGIDPLTILEDAIVEMVDEALLGDG
jgi:hypothetical protein